MKIELTDEDRHALRIALAHAWRENIVLLTPDGKQLLGTAEAIKDCFSKEDVERHRMEERAAIVAWLRSEDWDGRMEYVADCIEAGEHLK